MVATDLAYKSRVALRSGDRNTAVRLLDFIHRYISPNDPKINQSLFDAVYPCWLFRSGYVDPGMNFKNFNQPINQVTISSQTNLISVMDIWSTTQFWDTKLRQHVCTISPPWEFYAEQHFVSPYAKTVTFGSYKGTLEYEIPTGKLLRCFDFPCTYDKFESTVAFDPNGRKIAVAERGASIHVWDITTRKLISIIPNPLPSNSAMSFSQDGEELAWGSYGGEVAICDLRFAQKVKVFSANRSAINDIEFASNGKIFAIAASDSTVRIWERGRSIKRLGSYKHDSEVLRIAISPNSLRIASVSTSGKAIVWNTALREVTHNWPTHDNAVNDINFFMDCNHILTAANDGLAQIWRLQFCEKMEKFDLGDHNPLALSPDGKYVVYESSNHQIRYRTIGQSKPVDQLLLKNAFAEEVKTSRDGTAILQIGYGGVIVWRRSGDGFTLCFQKEDSVDTNWAISANGEMLAQFRTGGELCIWSTISGNEVLKNQLRPRHDGLSSSSDEIEFAPDGKYLVISSGFVESSIWNLNTNTIYRLPDRYETMVMSYAFSNNGNILATIDLDGTVDAWDTHGFKKLFRLNFNNQPAIKIVFSPNDKFMGVVLDNGGAIVWDVENKREFLKLYPADHAILDVTFSQKSNVISIAFANGTASKYLIELESLFYSYFSSVGYYPIDEHKLNQYDLNGILDLRFENELELIASGEVGQILAFAILSKEKALGDRFSPISQVQLYRANRLFLAALRISDSDRGRYEYSNFLDSWSDILQSSNSIFQARSLIMLRNTVLSKEWKPPEDPKLAAKLYLREFGYGILGRVTPPPDNRVESFELLNKMLIKYHKDRPQSDVFEIN